MQRLPAAVDPCPSQRSRSARTRTPGPGPRGRRRTSWTRPARWPQRSTISAPSRSVRRMPGSRQSADDVVAGPGLQPVGLQFGLGHAEGDRAGDLLYDRKGNASRPARIPLPQAVGGRLQPGAELATEPAAEGTGAGEDRHHYRRPTAVRELQLEVVDLADVLAVPVDQLPVQQLQPGLEDPSSHRGQLPTLVSISNGIVATATTWSPHDRYVSAYC